MFTSPGLTLGDQIFWIVDLFLKILGPEVGKLRIGAISLVIWNRMRKFERQFLALYARWKAGTLPKARLRSSAVRSFNRGERGEAQREGVAANLLPRGRGWLYKMLPRSAGTLAGRLGSLLLEHPEMKAFAAEAPQVGRLLRPICSMVWMKVPEYLALPKRRRVRKQAPGLSAADEEKLRRITARFPDTPPARAAKRVWRRMFEGKPVNLKRLSAVAYR